jgi:hypothetical protein
MNPYLFVLGTRRRRVRPDHLRTMQTPSWGPRALCARDNGAGRGVNMVTRRHSELRLRMAMNCIIAPAYVHSALFTFTYYHHYCYYYRYRLAAAQRYRVRFPALPDFLSSSGSGTGSTQPREDK